MGLLLLIIPSVLSLSADTSSWCFSPHPLPVFDNKIEPAAFMLTVTQGEHSAGCIALVSTIKTKFPLQTPDDRFFKGSDQCWRGKVKPWLPSGWEIKRLKSHDQKWFLFALWFKNSAFPWYAPDASWMNCFILQMVRLVFTEVNLKWTIYLNQKSCAWKAVQLLVRQFGGLNGSQQFFYSLHNGASIFMMLLICKACQPTLVDGTYGRIVIMYIK